MAEPDGEGLQGRALFRGRGLGRFEMVRAATSARYTSVIDGFVLSPNVEVVGVQTIDLGFENSDHNPVRLSIRKKDGS